MSERLERWYYKQQCQFFGYNLCTNLHIALHKNSLGWENSPHDRFLFSIFSTTMARKKKSFGWSNKWDMVHLPIPAGPWLGIWRLFYRVEVIVNIFSTTVFNTISKHHALSFRVEDRPWPHFPLVFRQSWH